MSTKKNYPYHVIFKQNDDLDGAMCETTESVGEPHLPPVRLR